MLLTILTYKATAQFVAFLLLLAAAWRWGAGPERACAGTLVGMLLIDRVNHLIFGVGAHYQTVDLNHAAIDVLVMVAFAYVAIHANRLYPLCLAALQIIALSSHFVREFSPRFDPLAYSIMQIAPSYLQGIVVVLGLWLHHRRVQLYGPYRSWRNSSDPSPDSAPVPSPND